MKKTSASVFMTNGFRTRSQLPTYLESLRWPDGPVCPHCGEYASGSPTNSRPKTRSLWKCGACRKQFTVTVGTIFEARISR